MLPDKPWSFQFFLSLSLKTIGRSGAIFLCSSANILYSPVPGTCREQKKLNCWLAWIYVDNERSPWIHSFWNPYITCFLRNGHWSLCLGNSAVNTTPVVVKPPGCLQPFSGVTGMRGRLWQHSPMQESVHCPCLGKGPCARNVLRQMR